MRRLLCLVLVSAIVAIPGVVRADDTPRSTAQDARESPSHAWARIRRATGKMRYPQRNAEIKKRAAAYVADFRDRGGIALGTEAISLGNLQSAAEQFAAAASTFRLVWANSDNDDTLRDLAAGSEARQLSHDSLRASMGDAAVAASVKVLLGYARSLTTPDRVAARSAIEVPVSYILDALHRSTEAHALRLAIVERDPHQVSRLYRSLARDLLHETHAMAGYPALLKEAQRIQALLLAGQEKAVQAAQSRYDAALKTLKESSPESITADGNLVGKPVNKMSRLERVTFYARRSRDSAEHYVERLHEFAKPFGMLGKPVPKWTLEHAFGDVKSLSDLEGKVVVLDFWATWCPWCVRSFPAIRDVLRDYEERGLAFVGVTASAPQVYAERYNLDEDMKTKVVPGERTHPAARLARGSDKPDGKTIFGPEEYPAKEKEVIATFIENHEMTWPVVMIDKSEPSAKYALTGWPHAVIIDRQGRIRAFKSGALLRDRPDDVKAFRKLIEDLLAEGEKGAQ